MFIDPISWAIIIGSALAGAAVGYFWEDIKRWATQVLASILRTIDELIEVTSDAIVYLLEEGTRVYKRMEVYVRNVKTGATRREYRQQEVSRYDIPDELNEQLERKRQLKIMQQAT
ncbi:MAG: hypothetical protein KAF91_03365 [Nostoc sp. TH1S01]|nr:hypothetical protein [Nostoc sp. TH1S01]